MTKDDLLATLRPHGQEHLLAFWDQLDPAQREALARQIEAIDFGLMGRLYDGPRPAGRTATVARSRGAAAGLPPGCRAEPLHPARGPPPRRRGPARRPGRRDPRGRRAGNPPGVRPSQGHVRRSARCRTRRCSRSIIEKIVAAAPALRRADSALPDDQPGDARGDAPHSSPLTTASGWPKRICSFSARARCRQSMPRPAACSWKRRGGSPSVPTATAACWPRWPSSGALDDIGRRGIRQLFYFQVDNPLVDVCGPEFIGYHLLSGSEISTQVDRQARPAGGRGQCGRGRRPADGDRVQRPARRCGPAAQPGRLAGDLGRQHRRPRDRRRVLAPRWPAQAEGLPFHVARKKVACIDAGRAGAMEPAEPNAIKFERFIFDLMPRARHAIVVEVDPARCVRPGEERLGQPDRQRRRWPNRRWRPSPANGCVRPAPR